MLSPSRAKKDRLRSNTSIYILYRCYNWPKVKIIQKEKETHIHTWHTNITLIASFTFRCWCGASHTAAHVLHKRFLLIKIRTNY